MTFSSFDEHSTPLFRLLAITCMKLSDLVTFHISLFMHKFHNKLLPSYFDSFFNPVVTCTNVESITTIHEVQQINLITCLELEQTMELLIFAFKDQRYGILLGKIYVVPPATPLRGGTIPVALLSISFVMGIIPYGCDTI